MALPRYLITTSDSRAELISRALYLLGVPPKDRQADDATRLLLPIVIHPDDSHQSALQIDTDQTVLISHDADLSATIALLTLPVTEAEVAAYQAILAAIPANGSISASLGSLLPSSAHAAMLDQAQMEADGWFPSAPEITGP